MRDNMTQSEQLKWILAETGRQLITPVARTWEWIMDTPYRIKQNRQIRNLLEDLTDETLIDRIANAPKTVYIPVQGEDEAVAVPVRMIIRRVLSIDGILAR